MHDEGAFFCKIAKDLASGKLMVSCFGSLNNETAQRDFCSANHTDHAKTLKNFEIQSADLVQMFYNLPDTAFAAIPARTASRVESFACDPFMKVAM